MQDYKEPPRSERISHSVRAEDRHDLQSTEDHISSDSEGNRGPMNTHFHRFFFFSICNVVDFFNLYIYQVLVTVSLMLRHHSCFWPRRLHGAPALPLLRPHKETHERLHGMGQG